MKDLKNSCEYEPWQNPAERPWRDLEHAAREFLLRGIRDSKTRDGVDPEAYWTYAYLHLNHVHTAIHGGGKTDDKGHITHLRVPFCLAYAKTPSPYRHNKLAPQAESCVHLGWSRTKPGYVLQVFE